MPTPAYLSLEGTKQGLITAGTFTEDSVGNIFQEGHEDQILVQCWMQISLPNLIERRKYITNVQPDSRLDSKRIQRAR